MSNYNSTNTTVLTTHEQADGNVRMLLLHICDNGNIQYIIGSYFTQVEKDAPKSRAAVMLRNEAKSFAPTMREYVPRYLLNDLAKLVESENPTTIMHYSWDWGHYFDGTDALLRAVDYWKSEVLGYEEV